MALNSKINLRLERDLFVRLDEYARRTHSSKGSIIRQALDKFLSKAKGAAA